jgi:hypothetical protein
MVMQYTTSYTKQDARISNVNYRNVCCEALRDIVVPLCEKNETKSTSSLSALRPKIELGEKMSDTSDFKKQNEYINILNIC